MCQGDLDEIERIAAGSVPMTGPHPEMMLELGA
jgi:hypothetical protein